MANKKENTRLVEFCTNVCSKEYTKCELGKIIGSDACTCCKNFVGKLSDNKRIDGHFIHTGIVECRYVGNNEKQ